MGPVGECVTLRTRGPKHSIVLKSLMKKSVTEVTLGDLAIQQCEKRECEC